MSDANNLVSPERAAELEQKMAAFNRQMSFAVVRPAAKTTNAPKDQATLKTGGTQPKPLGW